MQIAIFIRAFSISQLKSFEKVECPLEYLTTTHLVITSSRHCFTASSLHDFFSDSLPPLHHSTMSSLPPRLHHIQCACCALVGRASIISKAWWQSRAICDNVPINVQAHRIRRKTNSVQSQPCLAKVPSRCTP